MKRNTKVLLGALAVTCGGVGLALATPIIGIIAPLLAVGNQAADLHARAIAQTSNGEPFRARLETEGPATVSIQDFSFAGSTPTQSSQNGWHSHPGMVVVTLLSGSIRWYDQDCEPKDYKAGDSWVEGSQLHAFRVTSTTPVHGMAVFITAQGEALRTDESAPACAAGLGL
jgi:quercetin dioxygenase-like cupin family protein